MSELFFYMLVIGLTVIRYKRRKTAEEFVYEEVAEDDFADYDSILKSHFHYYNQLNEEGKHRFIGRVMEVQSRLAIQGRDGFEITDEVAVLTSACMVQLTFGFQKPYIRFVEGVIIFPEVFYSKLVRNWVKGLTLGHGVVILNWEDFIKGYEHTADTYNLGLHEFAHALNLQTKYVVEADQRLAYYYHFWEKLAQPVFIKLRNGKEDFFRPYGGTNKSEFFSVCVENFFEVPAEFEKELPDLYYHLCYLLRQNPLNISENYAFNHEDADDVNESLELDVPVFEVMQSVQEFWWWELVSRVSFLLVVAGVGIFISVPASQQLLIIRLVIAALVSFGLIRWYYYRNTEAIINKKYIMHVVLKLLPFTFLMAGIYSKMIV